MNAEVYELEWRRLKNSDMKLLQNVDIGNKITNTPIKEEGIKAQEK